MSSLINTISPEITKNLCEAKAHLNSVIALAQKKSPQMF
jgi:hypothetical protein